MEMFLGLARKRMVQRRRRHTDLKKQDTIITSRRFREERRSLGHYGVSGRQSVRACGRTLAIPTDRTRTIAGRPIGIRWNYIQTYRIDVGRSVRPS